MAAGLGFKTFTTGDVLTAGDTNGYLMQGVWVFADAAARTAAVTSPQEGNMSFLKDTNSTEYYSGSAWVAVGGSGGGGKVLQVVMGSTSTEVSNSTLTFVDSGITATITPTLATSKVLVLVTMAVGKTAGNAGNHLVARLMRGATNVLQYDSNHLYTNSATILIAERSFNYLDTPATTSATTYKVQFNAAANAAAIKCQYDSTSTSTIILLEIGA